MRANLTSLRKYLNTTMISDKEITFICHVRIDNHLRRKNLWTVYAYYKNNLPNCRFVFVYDGSNLSNFDLVLRDGDTVIHLENKSELVKKCEGYNLGAKHASTKYLVFLDIDIIVDCTKLLECITEATETASMECMIGYNRTAMYMTEVGEKKFLKSLNVQDLFDAVAGIENKTGCSNENAVIGNTQAVGGCLVMTNDSFNKMNGFNPFFQGWGYEDNEVISRAYLLGLKVRCSGVPNHFLYHLPHIIGTPDKSRHRHYRQNEAIVQLVESLNKKQLQLYIKQW